MFGRTLVILTALVLPAFALDVRRDPDTPIESPREVITSMSDVFLAMRRGDGTSNYLGWYMTWGAEGTCIGGPDGPGMGQNPDNMDVWLKGDGVSDLYVGHTEHSWPYGCEVHTQTWLWIGNPPTTLCNGSTCGMYDGTVYPHQHHGGCWH